MERNGMKACLNKAAVNFEEDDDGQSDNQPQYVWSVCKNLGKHYKLRDN
jgi:hypothetical protein